MKKAILFIFSGTGNTSRVGELFRNEFELNQVKTDVVTITDSPISIYSVNDYDYVGIAYPIHAFNAPLIVTQFIVNLPKTFNKPLFIIKTSGEPLQLNNISSGKILRILKRKGYVLTNEYHYAMPYNMIFRHSDATAFKMWQTVKALAPIEAREILKGEKHILKRIPLGRTISFIFRIEHGAMRINGKFFKVDYDKCIGCGKCVNNCPTHNIELENGKFKFGANCTCCVRCSFNCPTNAIDIALLNGWKVNGAYDMENVEAIPDEKHKRFCRHSYEKYFNRAEEKIARNN